MSDPQPQPSERPALPATQPAWNAWIDHVKKCRSTCRTDGMDCSRARILRKRIRETRETLRKVRAVEPQEDSK